MALRDYLATEVALDHVEGHLSRREALKKLGLLGLSTVAATGLLAACAEQTPQAAPAAAAATPAANPGYDVAAAIARTSTVTFPGTAGTVSGAYAAPTGTPPGAVLVVHENKGLTDFIRAVTGRLAGDGYAALAPDLLSRAGGTAAAPDATAALGNISGTDLVADLRSGLDELGRRHPGVPQAAVGFCFGGGMVWQLLDAGAGNLAVAVPFYGPVPDNPAFSGNRAAVLGIFAELDSRVNAGMGRADTALTAAGMTHEFVTVPGVDHAFFN
ncbi:MAG: carboxymethylenebutenolidase, partial [Pseudonocardiales bacterium]|nr:carboxymethylenebutenolidase [Pseudonocardiales bacterium]